MAAVIPAVTRISPRIIRILGCNPSTTTLQGTNTYIIGTGKRRILIDTGDADVPQYINHLKAVLHYEQIDLAHIFITHRHYDHIGGLKDIFDEIEDKTKHCQVWKFPSLHDNLDLSVEIEDLKDGQEFAVEGATIRAIHTPGHTDDHMIFHLLEDNAIFTGDCILGEGTAVFEDLFDYMNSLYEIERIQPEVIYPGHGNVIQEPMEKIQFDITHRVQREQQIMEVLLTNSSSTFCEEDLVKIIYENLPNKFTKAAECNVNHHLHKLLKENRVKKENDKWQIREFNLIKSR